MTNEDEWNRVKDVVAEAWELPPEARARFVEQRCPGDAELADRVLRMLRLADEEGTSDFLEPPSAMAGGEVDPDVSYGDFEIVRELGRGGMGAVFLARQRGLGRYVALKVFVEGLLTSDSQVERFHREAQAVARLDHPGIVTVYASGSEGATHWFAMDYIKGHDLAREIELQRDEGVSPGEQCRTLLSRPGDVECARAVARVGQQVAEALQFAHEHGLVHRDIKPQNLLLRPDGTVLVADFGIARDERLGSLTQSGEVRGTPFYMSPEQARVTDVAIDHRTDVFSLGVVLYELATLRRPYDGATRAAVLEELKHADPVPIRMINPGLPRDLEVICAKALRKDPRDRYLTAGALAADLSRYLSGEPIVARAPGTLEHFWRVLKRRGRRIAVAVAVIAAGIGGWYLTDRIAESSRLARLTVRGVRTDHQVGLQWLDPIVGGVDEGRWFGLGPLVSRAIEPGYVRVVVGVPGSPSRQFTRELRPGELTEIVIPEGGEAIDLRGMVRITGGVVRPRDPERGPLTVALNYTDTPVDDFYLDATEVSNADYRAYLDESGTLAPSHWAEVQWPADMDLPVVGISWLEARSYAEWTGKRLPSYAEWTWAARGAENRVYPWPDPVAGEFKGNVGRTPVGRRTLYEHYRNAAESVTSHPEAQTASGIWHMYGNVREWTESIAALPRGEPQLLTLETRSFIPSRNARLVAGHAWRPALGPSNPEDLRTPYIEFGLDRVSANLLTGFRCAVGIAP